ncbi:hypothetical protein [Variovorax boronicumulans]|uniref:hypothetical protein n=1 Tax=Variovorax boronicumulans TaxID=436515 RepID=UPI001C59F3EF
MKLLRTPILHLRRAPQMQARRARDGSFTRSGVARSWRRATPHVATLSDSDEGGGWPQ